jgi:hypothetical protein
LIRNTKTGTAFQTNKTTGEFLSSKQKVTDKYILSGSYPLIRQDCSKQYVEKPETAFNTS